MKKALAVSRRKGYIYRRRGHSDPVASNMVRADYIPFRSTAAHPIRARGQTLVELLVVLFIIVLMISLLMPAIRRSIREAASTVCMANLREIHQGVQIYRHDHAGWVPTGVEDQTDDAGNMYSTAWFRQLSPRYLANLAVFVCPEDPLGLSVRSSLLKPAPLDASDDISSYGQSAFIMSGEYSSEAGNLDRHVPRRPMDTLLLADLGADVLPMIGSRGSDTSDLIVPNRHSGALPLDDGYDPGGWSNTAPWLTDRHSGGINMITIGGALRSVRTLDLMVQPVESYYEQCAAGDCTICLSYGVPHYSFAASGTYWWTGPAPVE